MRTSWMVVVAVAGVPMLAVALLLSVLLFGPAGGPVSCTSAVAGPVDPAGIPAAARVAGFGRAQLRNAALIIDAAVALRMDGAAQLLGVQTAIGESSLQNLDHGDQAINPDGSVADSLGLFQQQSTWGTPAERLDPTTAATRFFRRLGSVPDWQQMAPTLAINAVQGNQDPDFYASFRASAERVLRYLAGHAATTRSAATTGAAANEGADTGDCTLPSGDARRVAGQLLGEIRADRLTVLQPRYEQEIVDVAAGTQSADCGLDVRTLQLIAIALRTFQTVGVSDLNRKCTGSLLGAGTESSHWVNGGGEAVDFYALDGSPLTGGDPASLRLLGVLDAVVPAGARAGQVQCRPLTPTVHLIQFKDDCDHLHVDLAFTGHTPLTAPG